MNNTGLSLAQTAVSCVLVDISIPTPIVRLGVFMKAVTQDS